MGGRPGWCLMAAPQDEGPSVPAPGLQESAADPVAIGTATVAEWDEACREQRDRHDKHIATLPAQFALRGFEVHVISEDGAAVFVVSRWGMSRTLRLAELEQFALQVGAV